MAPDKIYVKEFSEGISQMWSSIKAKETTANAQHEYIRKDALMEWAREKKKQLLENESANDEPSDVAVGIVAGLDMLIGKLNSM